MPTVPTMTLNEIFQKVATHLLTQMQQSRGQVDGSDAACRYHAPGGLSCAIGCLIPREQAPDEIEGLYHRTPVVWRLLLSNGVPDIGEASCLLSYLREIHDAYDPSDWASELRQLPRRFIDRTGVQLEPIAC